MPSPQTPDPNTALAILPARYASTRLPGKPLLAETGKPLIQHVVERVAQAKRVGRVLVATDDQRIYDAVAGFGGEAMMTRADHPNGTSRLAEVVEKLKQEARSTKRDTSIAAGGLHFGPRPDTPDPTPQIILNVQGDEPEIDPAVIDALVDAMTQDSEAPMGTVAAPLTGPEEIANPNVVKVVCDRRGRALYFSRSPIPFERDPPVDAAKRPITLRHLGLYAYRAAFLPVYAALPTTPLEDAEKLEQLRALEHGHAIRVIQTDTAHPGIDTPEQYAAFVRRHSAE
ncbi:3-deoxy-manno-octulosonate cytidylyltransferase [Phycisphaeraceae bacterium D3-23]